MITYEVFEDYYEEDESKPWKVSFYENDELLDTSYGFATKEEAEAEGQSYLKQLEQ